METKTIAVDFGKSNIYCRIEEALEGLEVGVLGKDTSSFKLSSWVKFLFFSLIMKLKPDCLHFGCSLKKNAKFELSL